MPGAFMFLIQNMTDTAVFITENIIKIDAMIKQTKAIKQPVSLIMVVIFLLSNSTYS
jgi:hypothetical protein